MTPARKLSWVLLAATALTSTAAPSSPEEVPILKAAQPGAAGQYQRIDFNIAWNRSYTNPYDPSEIEVNLEVQTPAGGRLTVPAFFLQPCEWLSIARAGRSSDWFYPAGLPFWCVRFAPAEVGDYTAAAVIKDARGLSRSSPVAFSCTRTRAKGHVRVSRQDARFFEHDDGSPFFPIGQNVAFIGQSQYLDTQRGEEVFRKLGQNGANFARVWACAEDWGMAIEARKSAWGRSWAWKPPFVPMPGQEDTNRLCVGMGGPHPANVSVSPSHPVAVKPNQAYRLTAEVLTESAASLTIELQSGAVGSPVRSEKPGRWESFAHTFTTSASQRWLGDLRLRTSGSGRMWIRGLSLRESGGGPELLWEADPNRPARGVYNQLDSAMLDRMVATAEDSGLRLQLCLLTRDLYRPFQKQPDSPEYQRAIVDAQKFFRYAVARWGYSTAVFAWEYFNENDPNLPTEGFHRELGRFLESTDPYRHLRTTSGWGPAPKHWSHPQLDIADLHWYLRPVSKPDWRDEVAAIVDRAALLRSHATNKPALLGEFGLADDKWGRSPYMARDKQGVHFHNALWASAFSGLSGTAMFWWWETLDQNNLYSHYRPLAAFVADIPFTTAGLRPVSAATEKKSRLLGWKGKTHAYLWIHHPEATWWRQVEENKTPPNQTGDRLTLRNLADGSYQIEWWDTRAGRPAHRSAAACSAGSLTVDIPPCTGDIACKVLAEAR